MADGVALKQVAEGAWAAPGARIIDRAGERRLPIGDDGFERAITGSVLVDKTMLVADVLSSGYTATLFCRPRRFGKTLNMTMLRAFLELPPDGVSRAPLFEGTEVWEAEGGRWRAHQGAYPVVHVSFNTVKKETWEASYGEIKGLVTVEYGRHDYLAASDRLTDSERAYVEGIISGTASDADYAGSLASLCRLLYKHHGRRAVVLVDEYDAPVMTGYTCGYYAEVVSFLKGWLTGALKDGGSALAFACLTGVQRISKESIFSDLNNLVVDTPLSSRFDERFGFTDAEVATLAAYLGHPGCMGEARRWYDGYRFGRVSVYNPWSALNYFDQGCAADVYWGNTSSNSVVGDLVRHAGASTLEKVYALLEPGGTVAAPLDLGVVFPDLGVRQDGIWSMLYLAGYLTTDDVQRPNSTTVVRRLRIPNLEVAELYRAEIVERFSSSAGGWDRLARFHSALASGETNIVQEELSRITRDSASAFDLTDERACHMLMLGLCFNMQGYQDPRSNREAGYGRYDIQLVPASMESGSLGAIGAPDRRPLITIEVKHVALPADKADEEAPAQLLDASRAALAQVVARGYDAQDLPKAASGRLRWGIAFGGKRVCALCERAD